MSVISSFIMIPTQADYVKVDKAQCYEDLDD